MWLPRPWVAVGNFNTSPVVRAYSFIHLSPRQRFTTRFQIRLTLYLFTLHFIPKKRVMSWYWK